MLNPYSDPIVIGEGSYGCVHKPALNCRYDNPAQIAQNTTKVSKLLLKNNAENEMKEYDKIDKVDRQLNYHLGKPILCKSVANTLVNKRSIAKCELDTKNLQNKINDYSLLIMEDGGIDLMTFADEASKWEINDTNKNKIEEFWLEAHRLLLGIKLFFEKGIIHFDLKPHNIVYNVDKNRLNFIDFGILINRDYLINRLLNSDIKLSRIHWSRPLELGCLSYSVYDKISRLIHGNPPEMRDNIEVYKILGLMDNDDKNEISAQFEENMAELYYTITNEDIDKNLFLETIITDFDLTIDSIFGKKKYSDYVSDSIDTIDSYGLGIAFKYVWNKTSFLIDEDLATDLNTLFLKMINIKLINRMKINDILSAYENILSKHHILKKHNKKIVGHKIIDNEKSPSSSIASSLASSRASSRASSLASSRASSRASSIASSIASSPEKSPRLRILSSSPQEARIRLSAPARFVKSLGRTRKSKTRKSKTRKTQSV